MRAVLKMEILKKYKRQRDFAKKIKIPECRLSSIVSGRLNPSTKDMKKILHILNSKDENLFTNYCVLTAEDYRQKQLLK